MSADPLGGDVPDVYSIAEARLRHGETLDYLPVLGADGYIVRGWTHLLAGWWRLGKSELLAAAVLPWLRRGLVVVWVTEEAESIWVDRADAADELYEPVPWERLILVDALSATPAALLNCVADIEEAAVVILDTVRECCQVPSMKDDDAVRGAVGPWLRRLRDGRRTVIAISQHRKAAGERGERVEGSVALPSMFDCVLELEAVPDQERRRRLTSRRRRAQVAPLLYEMDAEDRLVVVPDARSRSRLEAEASALAVIAASTEPLSTTEVRRRMSPRPSPDTALRVLTALAESGRISRDPPITEPAERRRVTWVPAAAEQESAAELLLPTVEWASGRSSAADFAADAPSAAPPNGHPIDPDGPTWEDRMASLRRLAELNERHQR